MKLKKRKVSKEIVKKCTIQELMGFGSIKRGVIINNRSYYIPMEVMPVNFNLKSGRERKYIINMYEHLLKQVQVPFSIYTMARHADARAHLQYMRAQMEKEENGAVKEMLQEYMQYVSQVSFQNTVRKRFIIMIPFTLFPGQRFDDITFEEAADWLHEKRQVFAKAIQKSGNEAVVPDYLSDDLFTAQILYELLNPKSSEQMRMVRS